MIVSGRYFLCFVEQNILLQLIERHGKFDLSAFLAFRVGKCHRNKNNAPESVGAGKMFTKTEGRGGGSTMTGESKIVIQAVTLQMLILNAVGFQIRPNKSETTILHFSFLILNSFCLPHPSLRSSPPLKWEGS